MENKEQQYISEEFGNGFLQAIIFAYKKSLPKETQELWCEEMEENCLACYGQDLLIEFLEENNLKILMEEKE